MIYYSLLRLGRRLTARSWAEDIHGDVIYERARAAIKTPARPGPTLIPISIVRPLVVA